MPRCQNSEVTLDRSKGQIVMHFRSQHTGPNFPKGICEILACSLSAYFQRCISMIVVCAFVELHSCCPDQCSQFSLVIGMRLESRAVASGGGRGARPPHLKLVPPHFTFGPPVATYIQYCILKMWLPLLLNPGDGPA